ncbi:RNase A-like domain-containing protein [Nitrospirillum pindoramense]|uniref:Bacterial CdiA-CT RNAse A domain-containing protein n=1 Tax=Nitrospirillum amazonense TaxID=28077 RepID=A0A560H8W5_9PROT|nr:RNase A-like domain-containing protein [Nitrospirillum amazonense]TWB42591.1 hypothetical protein FBZ90_106191 [Nitrospirillum amazonense]
MDGLEWLQEANVTTAQDDDGLSIILSPVQLSAILQGLSITSGETDTGHFMTRAFGALEIVSGAIEFMGASFLMVTPEPTMLTKVGGTAMALDAVDNVSTGLKKLWTGREYSTLTYQGAAAAARALGCDPDTADEVGLAVEIAVPVSIAAKWAALRIISIRNGWISVAVEDDAGGHIAERHVRKEEAYLRQRLVNEPTIPGAGTFVTRSEAEKFISEAMKANAPKIQQWATTNSRVLRLKYDAGQSVGWVIPRVTGTMSRTSKMIVVLRRATTGNKVYFILTAYPSV